MKNIKRKILEKIWKLRYGNNFDILWPDDLVDMETKGINMYHRVGSVTNEWWINSLGLKRMTRKEAEEIGGRPCEHCFSKRVLPNLKR